MEDSVVMSLNDYKAWYGVEKKVNRKIIRAFVKSVPRAYLIDILKEEKIIMQDWLKKGEKFKEYEK